MNLYTVCQTEGGRGNSWPRILNCANQGPADACERTENSPSKAFQVWAEVGYHGYYLMFPK